MTINEREIWDLAVIYVQRHGNEALTCSAGLERYA
jgi:hypothetical protein